MDHDRLRGLLALITGTVKSILSPEGHAPTSCTCRRDGARPRGDRCRGVRRCNRCHRPAPATARPGADADLDTFAARAVTCVWVCYSDSTALPSWMARPMRRPGLKDPGYRAACPGRVGRAGLCRGNHDDQSRPADRDRIVRRRDREALARGAASLTGTHRIPVSVSLGT